MQELRPSEQVVLYGDAVQLLFHFELLQALLTSLYVFMVQRKHHADSVSVCFVEDAGAAGVNLLEEIDVDI